MKSIILHLLLVFSYSVPMAFALNGRVDQISDGGKDSENWLTSKPVIVFALALPNINQSLYYEQLIKSLSQSYSVEFKVVLNATGPKMVKELMSPEVVGLVLVGHTYQTRSTKAAVFVGSDLRPIPTELLSAATPALRFIAFLGCHGKGVLEQYQVKYAFNKLPGAQTVYYTKDALLATHQFPFVDGVKHALKKILIESSKINFKSGYAPSTEELATVPLTVAVKDVVKGVEPRYVVVNHRIVGTLGDNDENSNHDQEYKSIQYFVPKRILRSTQCNQIGIYSAELNVRLLSDDYMIREISLESYFNYHFTQPLHFGVSIEPYTGDEPQLPVYGKNKVQWIRSHQWLDKEQSHWTPLTARFLSRCMKMERYHLVINE